MPSAVLEAVEVGTTGAGFKTGAGGATEAWASFAACCSRAILALSASAELMPGAAAGVTPVTVGAGGAGGVRTTAGGVTPVTGAAVVGTARGALGGAAAAAGGAAGLGVAEREGTSETIFHGEAASGTEAVSETIVQASFAIW